MHDKKLNTLYDICEALDKELEEAAQKVRGGMTPSSLDEIDKLTHALKSVKTTIAMIECEDDGGDDGYSGAWYRPMYYYDGGMGTSNRGSYADEMGTSNRGMSRGSYAQGYSRRGRGRDSMGRFTRGRSYGDGSEQVIEQMRGMLDQLPEDKRREIEQALDRV